MISEIKSELVRLNAKEVVVREDDDFEPEAGPLVEVEYEGAHWHLLPEEFLELLRSLPDGAGADAVHRVIEAEGHAVWHGPAPPESRDSLL